MSWLAKSNKRGYMALILFSNKYWKVVSFKGWFEKSTAIIINVSIMYHWSTWILSFIQVWSAGDLNEMANQNLHLLHIWITPPHQIMLTLIYQSFRANVNFPKYHGFSENKIGVYENEAVEAIPQKTHTFCKEKKIWYFLLSMLN